MALTGLEKLANALEAFNPETEIRQIVESHKPDLERLQRQQFSEGRDSTGKMFTYNGKGSYSPFTIIKKEKYGVGIGRITNHFTLYGKGDLYRQLKIHLNPAGFSFESSVPYFNLVIKSVGDTVLGLTEESRKQFYRSTLLPEFKESFESKTGVKLITK